MNNRFQNKIALVTGAGSGIGRAVSKRLANEGAQVVIIGRTESSLKEASKDDDKISYIVADIESSQDIERVLSDIHQRFGKLDILINNAGWAPVTPFSKVEMDEYDKAFGVNVRGLVDLTKQALPLLQVAKGNIINITSAIINNRLPNMSIYAGSKAAVKVFTQVWAKELAKDGIRVNSVGVGPIETAIYEKTALSDSGAQSHVDTVTRNIPLGRFGKVEEAAAVITFLASDEASFVTGSEYDVDGGFGA